LRQSDQEDRLLLGQRLALFGKVMSAVNLVFFAGFAALWSREPSVGPERAWAATLSAPSIFVQATYVAIWLSAAAKNWNGRALRVIDVGGCSAIAAGFLGITFIHPSPEVSIWEVGMALTLVLLLRALLVPSSARFTFLIGLIVSLPSSVGILTHPEHFSSHPQARRSPR
jgi:hypothetical protein